eukprot:748121-Hanusia_phi.AAC.3
MIALSTRDGTGRRFCSFRRSASLHLPPSLHFLLYPTGLVFSFLVPSIHVPRPCLSFSPVLCPYTV